MLSLVNIGLKSLKYRNIRYAVVLESTKSTKRSYTHRVKYDNFNKIANKSHEKNKPNATKFSSVKEIQSENEKLLKSRDCEDYEVQSENEKNLNSSCDSQVYSENVEILKARGCKLLSTSSPSEPPLPPPPKSPVLKYLLVSLALAGGGLGIAWFNGLFNESEDEKKSKKEDLAGIVKIPALSKDIPNDVPYLLIGGGTASFAAFRAIKSHDPKAKVMVITNESEMPYMRPPLSKELWFNVDKNSTDILKFKQWNGIERSLYYEPNDFYVDPIKLMESPNGGVTIVKGYSVEKIDVCNKTAILGDGTGIKYGECLIATGSSPKNLDIFHSAPKQVREKISVFKTTRDYEQLRNIIDKKKSVAIIGGGFLGSELSCALTKYGQNNKLKVYQIFYENGNMGKVLPEYLSNWTTERVREEGVTVIPKTQIKGVELIGNQLKLNFIDGKNLLVDHIVTAIGSEPNTEIALTSNLETDSKLGGFVVNAELEARRHVYVAGDAACFYDTKLGRRRVEHHDHAVVSGRLAGENMVGLKKPYTHQSMFWSDLGPKVGYEAIGIIDSTLPTVGVFAKSNGNDNLTTSTTDKLEGTTETIKVEAPINVNSKIDQTKSEKKLENNNNNNNDEDFDKGVIFYLRDDKVVGILLWNVFNRINIARKVITENKKYDDLNEVAKLFDIHEQN